MTPVEFKNQEGTRIQAVLGAIGALPAAALVFATDPALSAPGAPFFLAAIFLVVGAYLHWNHTDSIFWLDGVDLNYDEPNRDVALAHGKDVEKAGLRHVTFSYLYGLGSLACTAAGFTGVYASIRLPLSIDAGFYVAGVLLLFTAVELIISRVRMEWLLRRNIDLR